MRLNARVGATRGIMLWERLWRGLWPVLGVVGLFVAVALLDVLPALPGWLHFAVLAGFVAAFAVACAHFVRHLSLPDRAEARHRLERDSGLGHRPLSSLDERLATPKGDWESEALWRAHRARLRDQLARLRVGLPHPGLASADPLALRGALLLVLVVALATGYGDWHRRLAAAASPQWTSAAAKAPATLDLWINPPTYTAMPPLYLERPAASGENANDLALPPAVQVPVGSTLLAQVSAGSGTPALMVGEHEEPFEAVGTGAYRVETELRKGDRIAVRQNDEELGAWPLELIPDEPPQVEMGRAALAHPAGCAAGRLRGQRRLRRGLDRRHHRARRQDRRGGAGNRPAAARRRPAGRPPTPATTT